MAYTSWSVVFGEQPSAAKWNILGTNDASFNDGTGIADGAITPEKLLTGTGTAWGWSSFTPSWTNLTVGTGGSATNTGYYKQIGKTVFFAVNMIFGSSGPSMGSNPYVSLPVNASSNYSTTAPSQTIIGTVVFNDVSGSPYPGHITINNTSGVANGQVLTTSVGATYPTYTGISSTIPFAWGGGDQIRITGYYEAA